MTDPKQIADAIQTIQDAIDGKSVNLKSFEAAMTLAGIGQRHTFLYDPDRRKGSDPDCRFCRRDAETVLRSLRARQCPPTTRTELTPAPMPFSRWARVWFATGPYPDERKFRS